MRNSSQIINFRTFLKSYHINNSVRRLFKHGDVYGFMYLGPQVGIRGWFNKVGLFAEVGWGASIANVGLSF